MTETEVAAEPEVVPVPRLPRQRKPKNREFDRVWALVLASHPLAFFGKDSPDTKPLKLGIDKDLIAAHPTTKRFVLGMVVSRYTQKNRYLRAIAKGGPRVDLNGEPAGDVSPAHAAYAAHTLELRAESHAASLVTKAAQKAA